MWSSPRLFPFVTGVDGQQGAITQRQRVPITSRMVGRVGRAEGVPVGDVGDADVIRIQVGWRGNTDDLP